MAELKVGNFALTREGDKRFLLVTVVSREGRAVGTVEKAPQALVMEEAGLTFNSFQNISDMLKGRGTLSRQKKTNKQTKPNRNIRGRGEEKEGTSFHPSDIRVDFGC